MSIHVGDVGTVIQYTVKDQNGTVIDVSGATTKNLIIRNADGGTTQTLAGAFETDGTDGVLNFTSIAATWDAVGQAFEQVHIITASTEFRTTEVTRDIKRALA